LADVSRLTKSLITAIVFFTHVAWLRAETPQLNYLRYCQGCHGEFGQGSARNSIPKLKGVLTKFFTRPEGRNYLVQVADVAQTPISDKELADLLNWLVKNFGTIEDQVNFKPYNENEIRTPRLNRPANTRELRQRLIKKSVHALTQD
jgi:hypothetical protein